MIDTAFLEELQTSFRREASELLADLGDSLMLLEQDPRSTDLINRVFRAMHTLKGSGAAAGFSRMAAFVHHVEELFNRIRNGQLETTSEVIDAALKACDCCAKLMLLEPSDFNTKISLEQEVLDAVRPLLPQAVAATTTVAETSPADHLPLGYKVSFQPNREIFFSGTDPASLLLELTDMGEIDIRCDASDLSSCEDFDPEQCYLKWSVLVTTTQPESALRAIFQFVEEDCAVAIEALAGEWSNTEEPADLPVPSNVLSTPSAIAAALPAQDIRVESSKLDDLMRLAGELLVARGALPAFALRLESGESSNTLAHEMRDAGAKAERLAKDLQNVVMSIRMVPARQVFRRFARLVRDLGRSLDKEIELEIAGEETELDKTLIEAIGEPLMHIIRNAADHGIESRAERAQTGKSAAGHIHLSASTHGSTVVIEVRDDGKGLDAAKLKRRAIEKGLYSEAAVAAMDEAAAFNIIMAAGFSTIDAVTDLSGRGVGMDAVRSSVEALHGVLHIQSKMGEGTCFRIELPASLLVSKGILVEVSGLRMVLPMETIGRMVKIPLSTVHSVRGRRIAHIRGEVLPLLSLADALSLASGHGAPQELAVATILATSGSYGLVVDRFLGEVEVVIKPLSGALAAVPEYAGTAILGDGHTALVVNTEKLFSLGSDTYQILYISRSNFRGTESEVAAQIVSLLLRSRANNLEVHVTGALVFNSRFFGQVLEGPRAAVELLFERIRRDRRHKNVVVLRSGPVKARDFQQWAMAYAGSPSEQADPSIAAALEGASSNQPGSAERVIRMLRELVLHQADILGAAA